MNEEKYGKPYFGATTHGTFIAENGEIKLPIPLLSLELGQQSSRNYVPFDSRVEAVEGRLGSLKNLVGSD